MMPDQADESLSNLLRFDIDLNTCYEIALPFWASRCLVRANERLEDCPAWQTHVGSSNNSCGPWVHVKLHRVRLLRRFDSCGQGTGKKTRQPIDPEHCNRKVYNPPANWEQIDWQSGCIHDLRRVTPRTEGAASQESGRLARDIRRHAQKDQGLHNITRLDNSTEVIRSH